MAKQFPVRVQYLAPTKHEYRSKTQEGGGAPDERDERRTTNERTDGQTTEAPHVQYRYRTWYIYATLYPAPRCNQYTLQDRRRRFQHPMRSSAQPLIWRWTAEIAAAGGVNLLHAEGNAGARPLAAASASRLGVRAEDADGPHATAVAGNFAPCQRGAPVDGRRSAA